MGDLTDNLKKKGWVTGDLATALGYAEDIYGGISGAYAAYSAGKEIFTSLGFLDAPKNPYELITQQLQTILSDLTKALKGIEDIKNRIGAGSKLVTEELIADKIGPAHAGSQNAIAHLKTPNDEEITFSFRESQATTLDAIDTLYDESYWKRLYSREANYADPWSGIFYPDEAGPEGGPEYIWDYSVTLDAYLDVLFARSMVLLASDSEYRTSYAKSMSTHIDKLRTVYEKILGAFVPIRAPSFEEMKYVIATADDANLYFNGTDITSEDMEHPVGKVFFSDWERNYMLENLIPGGRWRLADYIYGVAEKYSGYACVWAYPVTEIRTGNPLIASVPGVMNRDLNDRVTLWVKGIWKVEIANPDYFRSFYQWFVMRHTLRTMKEHKRLYTDLGMPKLRNVIKSLYDTYPPAQPVELEDVTAWAVRSTYSKLLQASNRVPAPNEEISLRAIAVMLAPMLITVAPSSQPFVPNLYSTQLPPPIISLRNVFLIDEVPVPLSI
jgi:hypothetical protein